MRFESTIIKQNRSSFVSNSESSDSRDNLIVSKDTLSVNQELNQDLQRVTDPYETHQNGLHTPKFNHIVNRTMLITNNSSDRDNSLKPNPDH